MSNDDLILMSECPELTPISKAPSLSELIERAEREQQELSEVMRLEATARYGAVKDGRAYSVQNPALMSYQMHLGCTVIKRRPPELINAGRPPRRGRAPIERRYNDY